jgi:hypothetical protein
LQGGTLFSYDSPTIVAVFEMGLQCGKHILGYRLARNVAADLGSGDLALRVLDLHL